MLSRTIGISLWAFGIGLLVSLSFLLNIAFPVPYFSFLASPFGTQGLVVKLIQMVLFAASISHGTVAKYLSFSTRQA